MGQANQSRERVAIAITADGRRVHVRLPNPASSSVSILGILRLLGLGVLSLITGSRREPDGTRRMDR